MAWVLARVGGCKHQLGGPEVADLVSVAMEDSHEGELIAFGVFGLVVAFEVVVGGGEESEVFPAAFAGVGGNAFDGGFGDDDEVEAGGGEVFGGGVERVECGGAGGTG